ncbi:MAG: putative Ig domain-containing protein, partial [Patescibacteria group bacterium]
MLTLMAVLSDGNPLPGWLSFDAVTGTFSGTPDNSDVGNLNVSVIATDTGGLSATSTFALGVLNVNDAPEADTPLANLSTQQDQPFSFSVPASTFSDADFIYGDTLTYSATLADGTVLPVWLSFDVATGTFSGTPLAVNVGNLNVKVSATDTGGLSASSNFALNVNGTDAGAGYSTVTDDGNGNIATAYYDANGNLLSYSMQYSYSYSYSITYDANGKELSSIWQDSNGVSGSSSNTYDAAGNLLSHTWQFDSGDSGSETYDAAGNLLSYSRQYSNGYYYSDTYDATGNRLSSVWHDSNGASGSSSFIYDSAGNLLSYAWQNNSGASGSDTY